MLNIREIDFLRIESTIWVANKQIHVPAYDFSFEPLFSIDRPRQEDEKSIIARVGAIADYTKLYDTLLGFGYRLIHPPEQHDKSSKLEYWYADIQELTPKSKVFKKFPSLEEFYDDFTFPVFIKGNRQTSKHNPELSVARTEDDFQKITKAYQLDSILHWQKIVIREFIPLQSLEYSARNKVQISFEFRTFWWKKQLVGAGHYWSQYLEYNWTKEQEKAAISIAQVAANRLDIPFIAIDLALTVDNQWIIIECNDAQESGYCGVNPMLLWRNIVEIEKNGLIPEFL